MDDVEARQRLERMVAWDTPPLRLASEAVDDLLEIAKTTDRYGGHPLLPDRVTPNPAWIPTWDLRKAAAEGWRWKAALAASKHDFSADGTNYSAGQLIASCEKMVTLFSRRPGEIYVGRRRQGFGDPLAETTIVGNG